MAGNSNAHTGLEIIGCIRTPFDDAATIPIRPAENTARGWVTVLGRYVPGLRDLDGFDRIWLVYAATVCQRPVMTVLPPLSDSLRGVFATRSLRRPNPIGLSCVRLHRVEGDRLIVEGVDMLDGSPLLDVRPYVPQSDAFANAWGGWMENVKPPEGLWPTPKLARMPS